jgi:hypothetical protein
MDSNSGIYDRHHKADSISSRQTVGNQITELQLHHPERKFWVNNGHYICSTIVAISVHDILNDIF